MDGRNEVFDAGGCGEINCRHNPGFKFLNGAHGGGELLDAVGLARDDDGVVASIFVEADDVTPGQDAVLDNEGEGGHDGEKDEDGAAGHMEFEENGGQADEEHEPEPGTQNLLHGFNHIFLEGVAVEALELEEKGPEGHQDGQHPIEILEGRDGRKVVEFEHPKLADDVAKPEQ